MYRATIAVAAALLLSGCAMTSPVPQGVTPEEREEFYETMQNQNWQILSVPDQEQPVVEPIIVSSEELGEYFYNCLTDAGITATLSDDGGVSFTADDADERVSQYICSVSYLPEPSSWGYLSRDELDAVYDYYQDWLVPCLASHGYTMPLVESRADLTENSGFLDWNPYDQLGARITDDAATALQAECPYFPPWLYD